MNINLTGVTIPDGDYTAWLFFTEYTDLYDGTPPLGFIGPYVTTQNITGGSGSLTLPYPSTLDPLNLSRSYSVCFFLDKDADNAIGESDLEISRVYIPAVASSPSVTLEGSGEAPSPILMMTMQSIAVTTLNRSLMDAGFSSISPGFDPVTTLYSSSLSEAQPYVQLTTFPTGSLTTLSVNGSEPEEANGYMSSPVYLSSTSVDIPIIVSLGPLEHTYTLTVVRPVDTNSEIDSLDIVNGRFEWPFDSDTENYNVELDYEEGAPEWTLQASSLFSTIEFDTGGTPTDVTDWQDLGGASALAVGESTWTFGVTAEDGVTTTYYVLTMKRLPNTALTSLTVDPGTLTPSFTGTTRDYTLTIPYGVTSVDFTPVAADGGATVVYRRNSDPNSPMTGTTSVTVADDDVITVEVSNTENSVSDTREYTITIDQAPPWSDHRDAGDFNYDVREFQLYENSGTLYALVTYGSNFSVTGNALLEDTGSGWSYVGSSNFSGTDAGFADMAFAPDGTPYVVAEDGGIRVYKYSGGSWQSVGSIVGETYREEYYDIAVDSAGNPWVVFFDDTYDPDAKLTVKKDNGTSWELVGSAGFTPTNRTNGAIDLELDGTTAYVTVNGEDGGDIAVWTFNGTSWEQYDDGTLPLTSTGIYDLDLEISSGTLYVAYAANTPTRVGLLTANVSKVWSEVGGVSYPSSGNAAYGVGLTLHGSVPIVSFQDGLPAFGSIVAYAFDSSWTQLGTDVVSSTDATLNDSGGVTSAVVGGELFVGRVDADSERGIVRKYGGLLP